MQTTPAFVYLLPIVMLFGIGNVPGVVVTIIFALLPIVRLTILGINQVPADLIEAAQSFGSSRYQLLFKVKLPLGIVRLDVSSVRPDDMQRGPHFCGQFTR